jgi:ubiquinol-cytochrome c reductase cytochrome b subunit
MNSLKIVKKTITVDQNNTGFGSFNGNQLKAPFFRNVRLFTKNYLISFFSGHVIFYPTPASLSYAWSFGSLAGITIVIQIISGIFLAMHYTANIELAFNSVEFVMRDVPKGWFIRYMHANGASMFFFVVYAHVCRGLYYGSYIKPRDSLWCSGVILLLLVMATAFTGYVLPWGQMSLWGATVISSMVTVIPVAGKLIREWLWGGYTIKNPTLQRFYITHVVLPFLLSGVTLIHLAQLHKVSSSNPVGSESLGDYVPFSSHMVSKDVFAFSAYLLIFIFLVVYFPNVLNHPDNYIPADFSETPAHVVPEWYFLPYYAILRSIPHKAGGIILMFGSLLVLFILPFINTSNVKNTTYRPLFKICFWVFIADFIVLAWIGQTPVKDAFIFTGQLATAYYFIFFLFLIPTVGKLEVFFIKNISNKVF